jgi:hypothetical protein
MARFTGSRLSGGGVVVTCPIPCRPTHVGSRPSWCFLLLRARACPHSESLGRAPAERRVSAARVPAACPIPCRPTHLGSRPSWGFFLPHSPGRAPGLGAERRVSAARVPAACPIPCRPTHSGSRPTWAFSLRRSHARPHSLAKVRSSGQGLPWAQRGFAARLLAACPIPCRPTHLGSRSSWGFSLRRSHARPHSLAKVRSSCQGVPCAQRRFSPVGVCCS